LRRGGLGGDGRLGSTWRSENGVDARGHAKAEADDQQRDVRFCGFRRSLVLVLCDDRGERKTAFGAAFREKKRRNSWPRRKHPKPGRKQPPKASLA
jgi:hypothetical protein